MLHGQLSGGQTSRGQMAVVKCRGPIVHFCLCRFLPSWRINVLILASLISRRGTAFPL